MGTLTLRSREEDEGGEYDCQLGDIVAGLSGPQLDLYYFMQLLCSYVVQKFLHIEGNIHHEGTDDELHRNDP